MTSPRRPIRLLATSRTVRVIVCPLCAGLVLAAGASQHDRVHRGGPASLIVQRGPRVGRPVMYLREDGVFRGPEMDDATKAKRFGRAS